MEAERGTIRRSCLFIREAEAARDSSGVKDGERDVYKRAVCQYWMLGMLEIEM